MPQRLFFATTDDMLSIFEQVERKFNLTYALTGLFNHQKPILYNLGSQLPTLGSKAEDSSISCPSYLVMPKGVQVNVRTVTQVDRSIRYAIDQLNNPDSITVTHGGMHSPSVLISGRIATVSDTPKAKSLQSAFSNAVRKYFTRVNAFYVGPTAIQLLDQGCRLTSAVQSPSEYDLCPRA